MNSTSRQRSLAQLSAGLARAGLAAAVAAAASSMYSAIDPSGRALLPEWASGTLVVLAFGFAVAALWTGRVATKSRS